MDILDFIFFLIALLVALTVHEASHAMAAYYLGDPTAKMKGRLTLNPIAHLDLFGSIIFLVTQRIGWGKPVPVNPANFKSPVRDSALTALSGPLSNFVLAFAIALPLKYLGMYMPGGVLNLLWTIFHVNVFLGIFNLFPFPPLDGSQIIGFLVPKRWHRQYQNYLHDGVKYFVIIIIVDIFLFGEVFGFSFFRYAITWLHENVSTILLLGA
ncbi:MAG: site-2 protease family protein [Candidatus Peregrinibacteria bacterium]